MHAQIDVPNLWHISLKCVYPSQSWQTRASSGLDDFDAKTRLVAQMDAVRPHRSEITPFQYYHERKLRADGACLVLLEEVCFRCYICSGQRLEGGAAQGAQRRLRSLRPQGLHQRAPLCMRLCMHKRSGGTPCLA